MLNDAAPRAIEVPAVFVPAASGIREGRAALAVWPALAACLIVYLAVGHVFSRHRDFWSPDSAVRFVQSESLRRMGFREVSVPYPAEALDPEGRYFPAGPWFHFQRAGKHYLSYLPYFPAVSAVLYGMLGYPGLVVLPLLAGLAATWITSRVLRRRTPDVAAWGTVAVGLGTPLLIYSGVFWDHSLTAALAAGALAIAIAAIDEGVRPRLAALAAAGALLGLGTWLRNEMYLLAAAVVVVWPLAASRRRIAGGLALAAGAALTTGIQWMVNTRLYGSPLGYKGQGLVTGRISDVAGAAGDNRLALWIADKLGNVYYQFISPDFYAFNPQAVAVGAAVAGGLLLGGVLIRMGAGRQSRPLVIAGGALAALVAIFTTSGRTSISGLLPVAPFVILLLLGGPRARWEWFLWGTSAIFSAAVVVTGTHGGLQWGPRYLLPIVPALVWLAAAAVDRARVTVPAIWPAVRGVAVGLAAISVLVQMAGLDVVDSSIARNVRVNASLRTAPADVVVTSLEWLVLGAGPIYFEKRLMYVDNVRDFQRLVQRLADTRVTRWSYIPSSGGKFHHLVVERWTEGRPWQFQTVQDGLVNDIRVVTYSGFASHGQHRPDMMTTSAPR